MDVRCIGVSNFNEIRESEHVRKMKDKTAMLFIQFVTEQV